MTEETTPNASPANDSHSDDSLSNKSPSDKSLLQESSTEVKTLQGKALHRIEWPSVGFVSLIVLLGLALRLWGIGWSLPNAQHPRTTYHPDELVNLAATMNVDLAHGQLDTQFYNYGTLSFYLGSFAQTFGRGYGLIPTTPPVPADTTLSPVEQSVRASPELASLFLAGRLMTALLGTATIALLFALGNRLYGRVAGFMAAGLYAVAPLAVVHAHFLTVDVPATFFVTLALLFAARLLTEQSWKSYVLAGAACGLCAATKYNTGLIVIAPIIAHLQNQIPGTCQLHRKAHLTVMLIAAFFAFFIACPGPIINWNVFWNGTYIGSGVRYELFEHSRTGHGPEFAQTGLGWTYHLLVSLPYGMGIPLLLMSLAGLVYACRQCHRGDLILLAFCVLYYVATGLSAVRFARYMLPLYPVLCLFAARLICEPFPNLTTRRVMRVVGGLVLAFTGGYAFSLTRLMTLPDPRDIAASYLNDHARPGASIAFATVPWYYSPPLSTGFGELGAPSRIRAAQAVTRYQLRLPAPATEWDQSVLSPTPDYICLSNIETLHVVDRLHQANAVAWMNAIPKSYDRKTFGTSDVFGLPPDRTILPGDLLYIMPILTLYEKH